MECNIVSQLASNVRVVSGTVKTLIARNIDLLRQIDKMEKNILEEITKQYGKET